jgi:hypothetical protein
VFVRFLNRVLCNEVNNPAPFSFCYSGAGLANERTHNICKK